MKNIPILIIILCNLVNLINTDGLYTSDILECDYYFESSDYKSRMILKINGYKYRETVTYSNIDSYFSIPVSRTDLNVSYHIDGITTSIPQINCKYTKYC